MASNWQRWIDMAQESLEAGGKVFATSPRSSASRYYYASYQAMTALLLYAGKTPPEEREAWSHEDTPKMVLNDLSKIIPNKDKRKDLQKRLQLLYKVRLSADYVSADDVKTHLTKVRKDAQFLVKVAKDMVR